LLTFSDVCWCLLMSIWPNRLRHLCTTCYQYCLHFLTLQTAAFADNVLPVLSPFFTDSGICA
jgi:hypothetical protein